MILNKLLLLFAFPFIGGLIPLLVKKQNTQLIKALLILGGIYLLCVCLCHLIPEAFSYHNHNTNIHTIGLFILIGFLTQLCLEQFSHGIEHGHGCNSNCKNLQVSNKNGIALFISLSLHALIESIPLAYNTHNYETVLGIAVHHIPIGILLTNFLTQSNKSKASIILLIILFSCTSPIGYLLGFTIFDTPLKLFSPHITAFASGIILYISTTILLEASSTEHVFNKTSIISIILGIILYFLVNMGFSHTHAHIH